MGYHYIPKYYLNAFTTEECLWVHDRVQSRSYQTRTNKVANETGMYPDEVEKYLENKIEGPAKYAINKIRNFKPLTEDDRNVIAQYVVMLWKRVPSARVRASKYIRGFKDEVQHNNSLTKW